MFEELEVSIAGQPTNYKELIYMFNEIFREAPDFGSLGPPVYMVMARVMNTQGGFSAFTKEHLNRHFKKMFETWALFLTSKDSRYVLNTGPTGWLSVAAKDAMMKEYPGRTFEEVFCSDPHDEYYGYRSYEEFFNRRFRDAAKDRPTGPLEDYIVGAACESTTYAYQENVQVMDPLFIKDEAYSLRHLLADNYVGEFAGATVLQGFLNTTGYHRWHAPVNGRIRKIVNVPGTYFAQAPYTIGEPISGNPTLGEVTGGNTNDPDKLPPYLQSLRFFANTATRQLMFIDAKDTRIGLMCFISIGMTEISTCEATVFEGQDVVRGDELGMFHFGGSSSALVFRKDSGVKIDGKYQVPEAVLKINEPIGAVPV